MRKVMLMLLVPSLGAANEIDTHGLETLTAFTRSVLKTDAALMQRLGFDRLDMMRPFDAPSLPNCADDELPYRDTYLDARGTWLMTSLDGFNLHFRCPDDFEKGLMRPDYSGRIPPPSALGSTPELRMEGWLMNGAIREDDLALSSYTDVNEAPDHDPWGDINRPVSHFYSPVTNSSGGIFTESALPWAMGESDAFAANSAPDPSRRNHFSYADAKRLLYGALTYQDATANSALDQEYASATRMSLFASSLKSLGHVIHLLQDTSSPQHVRGEAHNYVCRGVLENVNQDIPNRTYENFTNFRVTSLYNNQVVQGGGGGLYLATNSCEETTWLDLFADGGFPIAPSANPFQSTAYPIPSFSLPREFFTTRAAGDTTSIEDLPLSVVNARAGLADYTNRGFYTQDNGAGVYQSPPAIGHPDIVEANAATVVVPDLGVMRLRALYWKVPDVVAPSFIDTGLDAQGRAPIASASYWSRLGFDPDIVLTLANYTQMGDMLGPRAIAYSAGLINYFFRGKLEVAVPDQGLIAVINQGEAHTVDVDGYPRRGDQSIFGFTKVRLKVRNTTPDIAESGSGTVVPQGANSGELVAVARYHRNACYATNLSGQRTQGFAAVPPAPITNPTCLPSLPERTSYQEISVSAPLTVNGGTPLPGPTGALVDKVFDFSAQPIPVNAVDLFVQVVYRGQLGDEPDGIAVGNLDVREPTFVTAYNGSDYRWTGSVWVLGTIGDTTRAADFIHICSGNPSKLIYRNVDPPALPYPVGTVPPGTVRLAVITTPPAGNRVFRVQPTMIPTPPPSAENRFVTTKGSIRQAGREILSPAAAAAPLDCTIEQASGSDFWCNSPAQRRRGQIFGDAVQPIYYAQIGSNATIDVDAVPLPLFPGLNVRNVGEIRFDDETLVDCPPVPALTETMLELLILREQAAAEGILVD